MADFFSEVNSIKDIHQWYLDLADYINILTGGDSTAAKLLRYYLSPKEQKANRIVNKECIRILQNQGNLSSGTFILDNNFINKVKKYSNYYDFLEKKYIPIFFSEKDKNKGILKRLKEDTTNTTFEMEWAQSLGFDPLETGGVLKKLNGYFNSNSKIIPKNDADLLDTFVGLHNYTVNAKIKMFVGIKELSDVLEFKENDIQIKTYLGSIKSWKSFFIDYYDFNQEVGFTLPNPHYKRKDGIHPEQKKVSYNELKHSSLVKMVTNGLAAPFYIYGECDETSDKLLVKNREIKK